MKRDAVTALLHLILAWCHPGKQDAALGLRSTHFCIDTLPGQRETRETSTLRTASHSRLKDSSQFWKDRAPDLKAEPGVRRHHVVKQLDHFLGSHFERTSARFVSILKLYWQRTTITLWVVHTSVAECVSKLSRCDARKPSFYVYWSSWLHCKIKTNLELSVVAACVTNDNIKFACELATAARRTATQWHCGTVNAALKTE